MEVQIRLFNPACDYPGRIEVIRCYSDTPATEEGLRDDDARYFERYQVLRLVAEVDGKIVAIGSTSRPPYDLPDRHNAHVVVLPGYRGRGIGSEIYRRLEAHIEAKGGRTIMTTVRDTDPESRAFAERRGFALDRHEFESQLELDGFDQAPFAGAISSAVARGFRFFSLADLEDCEASRKRLYDLNIETGMDVPGFASEAVRPYADFTREVFEARWFRPAGQIFAAQGDRRAAMAAVGITAPGEAYNMHTGVLREFRGNGLATALKVLGIRFAQREGARYIRTNNDSTNAAMLAINRKLGYRPRPGILFMEKACLQIG